MKKKSSTQGVELLLSMLAVLIVYELGKAVGALLFQAFTAGVEQLQAVHTDRWQSGALVSGEASSSAVGAAVYGLRSLAMQLAGGLVCLLVWRRELAGRWRRQREDSAGGLEKTQKGRRKTGAGGWSGSGMSMRSTFSFFGLAVTLPLGLNLLLSILPLSSLSPSFQETAASQAAVPVWLGILLYGLAAPFSEELVFRGILYGKARPVLGKTAAMLFSGLLFGIYHGNLVQGIYASLIGTLLCYLYEKEGSLPAPVIFHGMANLAVYLFFDVWRAGERIMAGGPAGAAVVCAALLMAGGVCLWGYGKGRMRS